MFHGPLACPQFTLPKFLSIPVVWLLKFTVRIDLKFNSLMKMSSSNNIHGEGTSKFVVAPDSMSSIPGLEYEVFLSFRGPDTRNTFTDHLYTSLIDTGIRAYRDDEELRVGEEIGPELLKGINQSTIAIPIFSKGYAASKWCLKELAHIVECKRLRGLKVLPIFYDVIPSEVRNQTGGYGESFKAHEKCFDEKTIRDWKEALKEIGKLKGWEVQNVNRHEGELVREVIKVVLRELKKAYLVVTDYVVGVEHHVEEILCMIMGEKDGVGIFGIHGIGGSGKTTLAKVIYNHLLPHFESCSFLADIREASKLKGMQFLKKKLISGILNKKSANNIDDEESVTIAGRFSNKKVLILLDDVDESYQLKEFVGERNWFGLGSRIIITTRNKGIFDGVQVDWSYELSGMDFDQALQLFSKHAFRSDRPQDGYAVLSEEIVKISKGLPLALEVIGSLLCGKSKEVWYRILGRLKDVPPREVDANLRVTFEALEERHKYIFLDIICFFIGVDKRITIHFWDDSRLYPEEAIEVLQELSLIKIREDHTFWVHDQLRDIGREIITREHIMRSDLQSRLWNQKEATEMFMKRVGSANVHGLILEYNKESECYYTAEEFAKLPNLRFLQVENIFHFKEDEGLATRAMLFFCNCCSNVTQIRRNNQLVLSDLRWLCWPYFPPTIKITDFSLRNLVFLDLSWSSITDGWEGWSHIKMAKKLKILNLTGCRQLTRIPDLSAHIFLERLILEGCSGLIEIDRSVGKLWNLALLNLKSCRQLRKLPTELNCKRSLMELIVDGTALTEIPDWHGMRKLEVLSACSCNSLNNCTSFGYLTSLKKLSLASSDITELPNSIGMLVNLSQLSLQNCKLLKKLPYSIKGLVSLIELDLSSSGIVELPDSIGFLKNLKLLKVDNSSLTKLPTTMGLLERLEEINACPCYELQDIPNLPNSLITLNVQSEIDNMREIPDLSNVTNLKHLRVCISRYQYHEESDSSYVPFNPPIVETPSPSWIGKLVKLEKLELTFLNITSLHADLGALPQLKELVLTECIRLRSIQKLPSGLTSLHVDGSMSMEMLPNLSNLRNLRTLKIEYTPIRKLEGLGDLELLEMLHLKSCNFSDIDGLERLANLRRLHISSCKKLERLPDITNLKKLLSFKVAFCDSLIEIPGRLELLAEFHVYNCRSLEKIPDIPNSKTMRRFYVGACRKISRSN